LRTRKAYEFEEGNSPLVGGRRNECDFKGIINRKMGKRDFAAAVLLPHAAALAAAVLRQSAAVELTTHVEFLGTTVIGSLKQDVPSLRSGSSIRWRFVARVHTLKEIS
jgi:hypothetical protein